MLGYRRRLLALAEKLAPARLGALRRAWWQRRMYVYVTPGPLLVERALADFPDEIKELGRQCRIIRTKARGGGGSWPMAVAIARRIASICGASARPRHPDTSII